MMLVALLGCGGQATTGPGNSRGTTTQSTGTGGIISGGQGGGGIVISGDAGLVSGDAACVAESRAGEQVSVDLYVMQDKSGSMSCPTGKGNGTVGMMNCGSSNGATGPTRWASLTSALTTFVNSPSNAGIGIGLGFFPVAPGGGGADPACLMGCMGDCACTMACGCKSIMPVLANFCVCIDNSQSCNGSDYAVPAVEIAQLPGVASAITTAINGKMPGGSTPTAPALDGALQHAKAWATAHPARKTAVIYSTDGNPEGCDANNTIAAAASLAQAAFAGNPSIPTYVIGVGSDLVAGLNQIAAAGGTSMAYLVDTGGDVAQQLATALGSIRSSTLTCDYKIPPPSSGMLDFGKVNVQVQVGASGGPMTIAQVANVGACGNGPGWYYDNPAQPMLITLCPATCNPLLMTPGSRLEVLIGCKTNVRVN
jgi:hypothetical protein